MSPEKAVAVKKVKRLCLGTVRLRRTLSVVCSVTALKPLHMPSGVLHVSAAASAVVASEVVATAVAAEEAVSAAAEEDQENDDPSAAVTAEKSVVASHS